jgi:hypothetical protein
VLSRRRGKTFAVLVLLCSASAVSAFPTVISGNPAHSISTSDDCATNVTTYDLGPSAACGQISELGRVILQPPSGSQITAASENQRCLPALPSAIAMVLTGIHMYLFDSGPQDVAGCPGGAAVGGPDRYLGLARNDLTSEPKSP